MIKEHIKENQQVIFNVLEKAIAKKTAVLYTNNRQFKKIIICVCFKIKIKVGSGNKFFKSNETWLKGEICFPTLINECAELAAVKESPEASRGHPSKSFDSSSDRLKRRKSEEIRKTISSDELAYATRMNLRRAGQLEATKIVEDITSTSPTRAAKYVPLPISKGRIVYIFSRHTGVAE
ncbi:hypothetical protein JTB14_014187 [Gonioctena quinquepunctata]|nr:hypothetical protein JTB14_014187 [Gonioctena quinquepunctata]